MKVSASIKNIIVTVICYMYVLLFVYTAVSKFLDFESFRAQIGQSPLLSEFAGIVSWFVPILEITVSIMLIVPKFRIVGLFTAFTLMIMFTTYIFIILNFSPFVPCSCGGALESLGWTEHMVFNIIFLLLAVWAIFWSY